MSNPFPITGSDTDYPSWAGSYGSVARNSLHAVEVRVAKSACGIRQEKSKIKMRTKIKKRSKSKIRSKRRKKQEGERGRLRSYSYSSSCS